MELFFFFLFAGAAVATAAYVVIAKNPVNSAISLVGTFLCLSGIYVLLNAHFLAVIQVLVYAGAIMVLFIFVIMLLNLDEGDFEERRADFFKVGGAAIAAGLLTVFGLWFSSTRGPGGTILDNTQVDGEFGGIRAVSEVLFSKYLLPFEIASILLLVAIVGAVLIARRKA